MEIFENTKKEIGGGNLEIYGLLRSTSLSQKVNKNIEIIQNITTKNILEKILSNYEDPMSTVFIVDPMIFWYESAKKALELKGAKFVEYNGDIDEVISELRLIQFSSTTQEVNLKDSSSSGFEERLRFRVENPLDDENWKEELFGPTVEKKYTDNELYNLASEVVMKENYASIPLLQSKLKVGYTKASELIDMLEKNGHIGPYEGTNSRAVIFQKDQNQ
ncbi:DNA translocase FtsK, partial [Paenibacillus macquariensis]